MRRIMTGRLMATVEGRVFRAAHAKWNVRVPWRLWRSQNPSDAAWPSTRDEYMGRLRAGWKRRVPKKGGHRP